jgi:hypothetical protein
MAAFEELDLPLEPVDPTVLMQFSRYDTLGNLLVKIHRRDGSYDRRVMKAEDAQKMMVFLGEVLVENPEEVPLLVKRFADPGKFDG